MDSPKFDTSIDINRLDTDWVAQTDMARDYGDQHAMQRKVVAGQRNAVKVLRAQLKLAAYSDPASCGLSKATQETVEAYVESHPDVVAADQAILDAQYDLDMLESAREAIVDRRKGLENLVELWGMSYFATPRAPSGAGGDAMTAAAKRATRNRRGAVDAAAAWENDDTQDEEAAPEHTATPVPAKAAPKKAPAKAAPAASDWDE